MTQARPEQHWPIIAREGWPIVAGFVVAALVLSGLATWLSPVAGGIVGGITLLLCLWCVWFFRDPTRATPTGDSLVICPADGVVCDIRPELPPAELNVPAEAAQGMTRVSVFMNVFNVHVNRSPAKATISAIAYRPGKFFNASLDKASEFNERCALALALPDGRAMVVVQIAGLIARRIVCRAKAGDPLAAGQRFGLIRFGSRVDVYLPAGVSPRVAVGQKVVAGETVFADLTSTPVEPARVTAGGAYART